MNLWKKMAQGKLKVKTSKPTGSKNKIGTNKKGPQIQRRNNAPIKPKKAKFQETHRIKQIITKSVNTAMENELRERALDGKKLLTKKDKKSTAPQKS